jgi:ubiquinone/menaquinone biosynthesis C-methylase UbiE
MTHESGDFIPDSPEQVDRGVIPYDSLWADLDGETVPSDDIATATPPEGIPADQLEVAHGQIEPEDRPNPDEAPGDLTPVSPAAAPPVVGVQPALQKEDASREVQIRTEPGEANQRTPAEDGEAEPAAGTPVAIPPAPAAVGALAAGATTAKYDTPVIKNVAEGGPADDDTEPDQAARDTVTPARHVEPVVSPASDEAAPDDGDASSEAGNDGNSIPPRQGGGSLPGDDEGESSEGLDREQEPAIEPNREALEAAFYETTGVELSMRDLLQQFGDRAEQGQHERALLRSDRAGFQVYVRDSVRPLGPYMPGGLIIGQGEVFGVERMVRCLEIADIDMLRTMAAIDEPTFEVFMEFLDEVLPEGPWETVAFENISTPMISQWCEAHGWQKHPIQGENRRDEERDFYFKRVYGITPEENSWEYPVFADPDVLSATVESSYLSGSPAFSNVAAHYEELGAAEYDAVIRERGWQGNVVLEEALRKLDTVPSRVVDLGAGSGSTTRAIIRAIDPTHITPVDLSANMLRGLQEYEGREGLEAVRMNAIDFLEQPGERDVDLYTLVAMLPYVKDIDVIFRGMARRLRPNGHVMFTYDPHLPDSKLQALREEIYEENPAPVTVYRRTPPEIAGSLGRSGLTVVSDVPFRAQTGPQGDPRLEARFVIAQPRRLM